MTVLPADLVTLPPPRHVGIIMDGNGRWATARRLPRKVGHSKGVDALRSITKAATELGISYLTLYAFSSENWFRPADEVSDLMGLLRQFVRRDLDELHRNNVVIRVIGERADLAPDIAQCVIDAETRTRDNTGLKLMLAFNYGGRNEIVHAVAEIARKAADGQLDPASVDLALIESHLYTAGIPDPDLIIRTSGEQRLSNFLVWQSAYTEFVFVDTLWPDFTKAHLMHALSEYHRRERRFGARPAPAQP